MKHRPTSMLKAQSLKTVIVVIAMVLFCLLFVSNAYSGFFPGSQKFNSLKTKHFYIHYPEGLGPLAEEMRTITEEAYSNITSRLDWQPWGRTQVVLTDKTDQANGLASVIPYNYILIYVTPPDSDSSLDHYKDYLRLLFNHELTHIVHIDIHSRFSSPARWLFGRVVAPNGATPAWMREGMAVYEESQLDKRFGRNNSDYGEMILRTAYFDNTFPRIDQIAGLTVHAPGGAGPYTYGGRFYKFLAEKYGEDRMYKYQKEFASGLWLFSLNNKARRVYGKSYYKLWDEFKNDLGQKFEQVKAGVEGKGLTQFEDVVNNKDSQRYYVLRPNSDGYAYYQSGFDESVMIVIKPDSKSEEIHIKRKLFGQMSFSKTGRYLAFSTLAAVEPKTSHAEVYYYDLEKKALYRAADKEHAKKSMRAKDPDFSPRDGGQRWLVMVRNFLNTDQLYIFDALEKKGYVITGAPNKTQFSHPRFSPDGSKIVVSRKDPNGYRDIVVYNNKGRELYQITNDIKVDNHPVFSRDGNRIYFDSYRNGISNIYEYSLFNKRLIQVTNVLDGVFQPVPSQDGRTIYVQRHKSMKRSIQKFDRYTRPMGYRSWQFGENQAKFQGKMMAGRNYSYTKDAVLHEHASEPTNEDVFAANNESVHDHGLNKKRNSLLSFSMGPGSLNGMDADNSTSTQDTTEKKTATSEPKEYPSIYKNELRYFPQDIQVDTSDPEDAKKYKPLKHLLAPRYVIPGLTLIENSFLAGLAIGRNDPLYRHAWTSFLNYRSDAAFIGAGGTYSYTRYDPTFYIGALRYAVDRGNVLVNNLTTGTTSTVRFYEQRWQAYGGMAYRFGKSLINLTYFYEDRSNLTNLNANFTNMQPYAGFRARYNYTNYKKYADSISPESGYQLRLGVDATDSFLGSDAVNEEIAVHGDLRVYIEMPWSNHHVIALRAAAGWQWRDIQQFGAYRLGGPFGEGTGSSYSSRLFPLRGLSGITFAGDQALIFSGEYRLPLVSNANRGIGTLPIFLNKMHMSFFVDGGDIRYRGSAFDFLGRVMVSAGTEIMGDFVLGYGLPLTARLGYGVILTNRSRINGLTDATTKASLDYGSVYLQIGTMF
jgi:hypothetical protein